MSTSGVVRYVCCHLLGSCAQSVTARRIHIDYSRRGDVFAVGFQKSPVKSQRPADIAGTLLAFSVTPTIPRPQDSVIGTFHGELYVVRLVGKVDKVRAQNPVCTSRRIGKSAQSAQAEYRYRCRTTHPCFRSSVRDTVLRSTDRLPVYFRPSSSVLRWPDPPLLPR